EQSGADGLSDLPAAWAADQQRAGGEHDQADEPSDQGEREVLADGGGRGGGAAAGRVPQRGRSDRSVLGPAAPWPGGRLGPPRARPLTEDEVAAKLLTLHCKVVRPVDWGLPWQ